MELTELSCELLVNGIFLWRRIYGPHGYFFHTRATLGYIPRRWAIPG